MSEVLTLKAPAKLNLFLKVLDKRADGYHNIYSLIQAVNLFDDLEISKAKSGVNLSCNNPDLPLNENNLVCKAYQLLKDRFDLRGGINIQLTKNIPVGAGLGGGSSDAAAILKGVNQLYQLSLSNEKLAQFGAELGSDVPFFFTNGSAVVRGRGEILENVEIFQDYQIKVIYPPVSISTKWAYSQLTFSLTKDYSSTRFKSGADYRALLDALKSVGNDFQALIIANNSVIAKCIRQLISSGADYVALTGTGSAVFALYKCSVDVKEVSSIGKPGELRVFDLLPIRIE